MRKKITDHKATPASINISFFKTLCQRISVFSSEVYFNVPEIWPLGSLLETRHLLYHCFLPEWALTHFVIEKLATCIFTVLEWCHVLGKLSTLTFQNMFCFLLLNVYDGVDNINFILCVVDTETRVLAHSLDLKRIIWFFSVERPGVLTLKCEGKCWRKHKHVALI